MAISSRARLVATGTAIAGLAMGLVMAFGPSANAAVAAPGITVTPSTGLSDGATVTVVVTGFAPNTAVLTSECAQIAPGKVACPAGKPTEITTDATGAAKTPLTVVSSFQGFLLDGTSVGTVDCHTVECVVGVSDANDNGAEAPLAFN